MSSAMQQSAIREAWLMDQESSRQVDLSLYQAREIARSRPWEIDPPWMAEGAVTLMAIHLRDALQLLSKHGYRVDFWADEQGTEDVTQRITQYRNAACHNGSPLRQVAQGNIVSFARMIGGGSMDICGVIVGNPHPDDVAYVYGKIVLYQKRHIEAALHAAIDALQRAARENHLPVPMLTRMR